MKPEDWFKDKLKEWNQAPDGHEFEDIRRRT